MTQNDIKQMASACGCTKTDVKDIINTYVQTLTYGTSGAVIHMCTDFNYRDQEPISKIYYCRDIITGDNGEEYVMLVPTDHQQAQKWYVTEFIALKTITHIWFFDQYKRKPRIEAEAREKDILNNRVKESTSPMNYNKIVRGMTFPSKIDTKDL